MGGLILASTTPAPTPFANIKPPPLPMEIAVLAAPLSPAMFSLDRDESGVDLSGSGREPPPTQSAKTCQTDCGVGCWFRNRAAVCEGSLGLGDRLGESCKMITTPLSNVDVM